MLELILMAADEDWISREYVGHAFMCISVRMANGSKEDCFGFYPRDNGAGLIGTPGAIRPEFQKNPARFARITTSVRTVITDDQRRAILALTNEWNEREFRLSTSNCIDFVAQVARASGLHTPAPLANEWPKDYVERLAALNL